MCFGNTNVNTESNTYIERFLLHQRFATMLDHSMLRL